MAKAVEFVVPCLILLAAPNAGLSQTGGGYVLEKSVVASSGGRISGGNLLLESTIGQTAAGGPAGGGPFVKHLGFFAPDPSIPTAAGLSISGRVIYSDGRGVGLATVTIGDNSGNLRTARTNTFGYYRIDNVPSGETYVISAEDRRQRIATPPMLITATENLTNVDFRLESP